MVQVFHPATNTFSKFSIAGIAGLIAAALLIAFVFVRSPYRTGQDVVRPQPVPFSHAHHVGHVGIDCRYCHTHVEESSSAGIPPTETCMGCHSYLWSDSPLLEPVRASYANDEPLKWTRVHDLPDFTYFDHSVHVAKGVKCQTCHGEVNQMPLMWKNAPLTMQWCLDCHRHPEEALGPPEEVFSLDADTLLAARYAAGEASDAEQLRDAGFTETEEPLTAAHSVSGEAAPLSASEPFSLMNCSTCHR